MGRVTAARKAEKEDKSEPKEPLPSYTAQESIHPSAHPVRATTITTTTNNLPAIALRRAPRARCLIHFPLAMIITPIPDMATFPETLHKRPITRKSGIDEPMEEKREREKVS